ncbi:hypothetical protein EIP91_009613, partial [Steccherinum ochraceum]
MENLERFLQFLNASPSLVKQVKKIDIFPINDDRARQSWMSCALLQLSAFEFGAWLCLHLRLVDMQALNPLALCAWTRQRLVRVVLDDVSFTRYSQLQAFLSTADEVYLISRPHNHKPPIALSPDHNFGTLTAPPYHALRFLVLTDSNLPTAAMLMNRSWFRSSNQLAGLDLHASAAYDSMMPHIRVVIVRALELSNRFRLLTVRLLHSICEIQVDPHGTNAVALISFETHVSLTGWMQLKLYETEFHRLVPYLTPICLTITQTVELETLSVEIGMDRNRNWNQLEIDSLHWEALDDALTSLVNDSSIRYHWHDVYSSPHTIYYEPDSVPRKYRCINDVFQTLLPKFTSNGEGLRDY